jgi:hypothetical protein
MADPDPPPRSATAGGLQLTCRPNKSGNTLLFPYTLENLGSDDIYAMHALPGVVPASAEPCAKEFAPVVILGAEGDVIIGKFAAPLPADRRVAFAVVPLAQRLAAGGRLEGTVEVPLPIAETSMYFADLTLRQYDVVDITGVVFTIGYWRADAPGVMAVPAGYAPDLFSIVSRNAIGGAQRIAQRFPASGLQLFKRTDAFPRTLS